MKSNTKILGHQGFSLIEILVALALVAIVFTIVPIVTSDDRGKLESAILDFDRAVKVASNESILRNTVTRILIDLEPETEDSSNNIVAKYSVQFGPAGGIILPPAEDLSKLSQHDIEELNKKQSSFHSKFNSVEDFKEKNLPEGIEFLGMSTSYQKEIQKEGKLSIYFYPTGEKDDALIFLASNDEISYLEINSFSEETILKYEQLTPRELELRQDSLDNKLKDIHSQWIRN